MVSAIVDELDHHVSGGSGISGLAHDDSMSPRMSIGLTLDRQGDRGLRDHSIGNK